MGIAAEPIRVGRQATGPGFRVFEVDYAPGWRQPAHAHDYTGVTLVLAGGFLETAGGREESATALSVVVKPAGVVPADRIGNQGARTVLVEIHDPPGRGLGRRPAGATEPAGLSPARARGT